MSTKLPTDDFTPTEGSTVGLDGYPDTAYNEGVLNQWTPAAVRGLAGIPDGVIGGGEQTKSAAINFEGFTLPEELEAEEIPDLVDHTWLDPEQSQDPSRLPKTPHVAIWELEEAWGKHRTDGIHRVPLMDKDKVTYEASLKAPVKKATVDKDTLTNAISRAWRRITAGTPIKTVGTELAGALGDAAPQAKSAFEEMRGEVGLIGNVYVRADAYPKCASGKWNDVIRKTACDAQYVVAKPDCSGCIMAQQGRCAAFGGRRIVDAVPYDEALQLYRPRIAAAGAARVASGDAKQTLRRGFVAMANAQTPAPETNFPTETDATRARSIRTVAEPVSVRDPAEVQREQRLAAAKRRVARYVQDGLIGKSDGDHLVSRVHDANEMLRRAAAIASRPIVPKGYTGAENDLVKQATDRGLVSRPVSVVSREPERQRVHADIARWQKEGKLSKGMAQRLIASTADPADVSKAASELVALGVPVALEYTPTKTNHYSGINQQDGRTATRQASKMDVMRELQAAEIRMAAQQRKLDSEVEKREHESTRAAKRASAIATKVASIIGEIDRGVRGTALAAIIRRTFARDEIREASVALDPVLKRTNALTDKGVTRKYADKNYTAAPQFVRPASTPITEVSRLARWVRRLMAEGAAGAELDARIQARFASGVRTAGADTVSALRRAHEGLSGHIYVDAAAYATPNGTEGCDEGARHHRTNAVPAVLEIQSKCASCVHRKERLDGRVACSLYAKPLVKDASEVVADPAKHQRDMIRLADAPDHEHTASLFANTYNQNEFNLGVDTELDNVVVEDMPEPEAVGEYFFGGIEID